MACLVILLSSCLPGESSDAIVPVPPKSKTVATSPWYILPSERIANFDARKLALRLEGAALAQDDSRLQPLREEINIFIKTLLAKNFEEYMNLITLESGGRLHLADWAKKNVFRDARALSLIEKTATGDGDQVLEPFWLYFTHYGAGERFFIGYVRDQTSCVVRNYAASGYQELTMESYMRQLSTGKHAGIYATPTYFARGDTITASISRNREITVATFQVLLSTSVDQLAYPVIVRYFWSEQCKRWLPFDIFQLFSGERVDVIF